MPLNNIEIVLAIKKAASNRGVTIKQMLSDCNINPNFLYDLRSGNSPSIDKLVRIADYLGVKVSTLIDGEDSEISAFLEIYKNLSPEAKAALRTYMTELVKD